MEKNKILKSLGTLVLGVGLAFNSYCQNKEIPCLSDKEVEFIVSEIPKHFKQTDEKGYLIEFVPEAKKGYNFGGELSVYIPDNNEPIISIFDRTNINPLKWYNVSNWHSKNKGCSEWGIYLNGRSAIDLSKSDAQKKFNESLYKIKKIIKEK